MKPLPACSIPIIRHRSRLAAVIAIPVALAVLATHAHSATDPLPRSTPEAQGISSRALLDLVETVDRDIDSLHSLMIVRHGRVVAEGWWAPYGPQHPHELYSLSKSFTSTAVGFAIAEGLLSLDDPVLDFFPDDTPATPDANLKAMRVRDLLSMATGHQDETSSAPDRISPRSFLAHPVPHKPGTHFRYNTPATFMLSAIVQKRSGASLLDYLRPRLFEPLGIENPTWATNSQGISLGGYGLSVRTEDIARFGQWYLQKGEWNGRQLIPASWVDAASARQVSNGSNPASDWDQGYGYQFWRCRHGAYRGDGAFGQYCIILPQHDAVVAITAGVRDMQAVLNRIWDQLLPAFGRHALPGDPEAAQRLAERLRNLKLRTPDGSASSSRGDGILGRQYLIPANDQQFEALRLSRPDGAHDHVLNLRFKGVDHAVTLGFRDWRQGEGPLGPFAYTAIAASGAWTADDTFTARVCAYETPFVLSLTLRFADDEVVCNVESNVGFGPTRRPQLVGRRE